MGGNFDKIERKWLSENESKFKQMIYLENVLNKKMAGERLLETQEYKVGIEITAGCRNN